MLQYNNTSWHFRLVLYVFGNNFFTERDSIDVAATEKAKDLVFTRKPKIVNFCPYCRAILWGVLSLPFVFVWRKIPHKEKKPLTHKEIMRKMRIRSIIVRLFAGGINIGLGLPKVLAAANMVEFYLGLIQIVIGVFLIFMFPIGKFLFPYILKLIKFVSKYLPEKKIMSNKPQRPSLIMAYLHTKHLRICPPVAFVDPNDTETRV